MNAIDLSHTINESITVFNENERPQITRAATLEKDGYAQLHFSMYTHNSTHIDAPFHMIEGGKTLDQFTPEKFIGKGWVADVRNAKAQITRDDMVEHRSRLESADFLLLNTGWDQKWNTQAYKRDFPVLSTDAAEWLMQFHLKGVGLDTISIDPVDSIEVPNHKIFLGNDVLIIENLTNLDKLNNKSFTFSCLPLKFENADGSPVRAIAMLNS